MADPIPPTPNTKPADAPTTVEAALAALTAAQAAVSDLNQASHNPGATPKPFEPVPLTKPASAALPKGIDLLSDVNLNVKIELGRTRMLVEDVLKLADGAVVELDKLAGDPVDVYVNDRHIARGEVLVLNDNFCVRINEIIQQVGDGEPAVKAAG